MAASNEIQIDKKLVSRLLLGALSEQEQRMLAVRLLELDSGFRLAMCISLEPFEMFDLSFVAEYAEALARRQERTDAELAAVRREILDRATRAADDLGVLAQGFTVADLFSLGEVTRRFFSWTMAEYLLARGRLRDADPRRARTHLYLARMVIDVVDILGAAGHSPRYPSLVADVRRRIHLAYASLGD